METSIIILLVLLGYFMPTWLAAPGRRMPIFILNAAFGWTLLGWVGALVLSARSWRGAGR